MELVLDENGKAVLKDGFPVYKYEDGSESPFNAKSTLDNLNKKIEDVTQEKTRHFTNLEKAKKDLKIFKGIDPKIAAEDRETVKNLKSKDLLDANGVKVLKADMLAGFEIDKRKLVETNNTTLQERDAIIAMKEATIKYQAITQEFTNSEYFSGKKPKTIYPPADAVRIFGHLFEVDGEGSNLKIFAKDKDGTAMMSQKNHGEPADFNEAMAKFIDEHPEKARILNTQPGGPLSRGNLGPGAIDENASSTEKIAAGLRRLHGNEFGQ